MRLARITIQNFRGIQTGAIHFVGNAVLVGDNNSGKSTVLEAIDLVLGPERLSRSSVIDEHDFYAGRYIDSVGTPVPISIEVVVIGLNDEQLRHFRDHLEWWDVNNVCMIEGPPVERTDGDGVFPAIRLGFLGAYDPEEDDFSASTFFFSPQLDNGDFQPFRTYDKRLCGFLFLRTLRTGTRALSLERGSLLDIILRLQERRVHMWEDVLNQLRVLSVAEKPELGITSILSTVQDAVRTFVHADWADNPQMRVSDLTRESLRRILTVFMGTGAMLPDGTPHAAPFQHQGTGTINTLVLALLSQIAELKQNVIFAMEEPEIAIPPHAQKRIVDCICQRSAQALFTSHSPYVLEEFDPANVLVIRRESGTLSAVPTTLPPTVKPKSYRAEFRTRFCEALLARRVLIVEGRTEYDAVPAAARRLHELEPTEFRTLESLGIAVVDAQTDTQVLPLGRYFANLGKQVFAIFDKQEPQAKQTIQQAIPNSYENPEKGFEDLLLNHCAEAALRRYAGHVVTEGDWPPHLSSRTPDSVTPLPALREALRDYLRWTKGAGDAADLIGVCSKVEMPSFLVDTLSEIQQIAEPSPVPPETVSQSNEPTG